MFVCISSLPFRDRFSCDLPPSTDRVLYTPERLRKLGGESLAPGSPFTITDRLALVSDALVLASSGLGSTSAALSLIDNLRGEPDRAFIYFLIICIAYVLTAALLYRSCLGWDLNAARSCCHSLVGSG